MAAMLHAPFLGMSAGLSVARVLRGAEYPSDKTTLTPSLAENVSLANYAQGASAQAASVSAALTFQGVLVARGGQWTLRRGGLAAGGAWPMLA